MSLFDPYECKVYKWICKNTGNDKPNLLTLKYIAGYFAKQLCIKATRKDYRKKENVIKWLDTHYEKILNYVMSKDDIKIEGKNISMTFHKKDDYQIELLTNKISNIHIKKKMIQTYQSNMKFSSFPHSQNPVTVKKIDTQNINPSTFKIQRNPPTSSPFMKKSTHGYTFEGINDLPSFETNGKTFKDLIHN